MYVAFFKIINFFCKIILQNYGFIQVNFPLISEAKGPSAVAIFFSLGDEL